MASSSTTTPRFRLLLHGKDGSIPYLTPALLKLVFCPNDDSTSSSEDDCWKWHRQHLILGVAVKDTCVTTVYRDASSSTTTQKKKRKTNTQGGSGSTSDHGPAAKRTKKEQSTSDDDTLRRNPLEATPPTTTTTSSSTDNNDQDKKKPAGYTFLTPSQSSQNCAEIHSHLVPNGNENNTSSNYMHTHLRIPRYISTMIVPTFSLDYPENNTTTITEDANKEAVAGEEVGTDKNNDKDENKKHASKNQPESTSNRNNPKKKQQQQSQKKGVVIPNSTKDTMPVKTPHGWQKLQPEQYWDAVVSLTTTASNAAGTTSMSCKQPSSCEGAVGLFDHMGIASRDQINYLFAKFISDKEKGSSTVALTPQAQKSLSSSEITMVNVGKNKWGTSLQRLVQRTNDWTFRTQTHDEGVLPSSSSINFWTPVHMAASHLPLDSLLARPRIRNGTEQQELPNNSCQRPNNVAIVGWDAISYSRQHRRQALRELMTSLQQLSSSPTITTLPSLKQQYLVLSVSNLQSILDAARGGVSIIGTDLVREWSHGGWALCLDLTLDKNTGNGKEKKKETDAAATVGGGGKMDLREDRYARDSLPILVGCKCVVCRPREKTTSGNHHKTISSSGSGGDPIKKVPSFTRAYIHHLLKAKEMLAETLLFVHNLHQVLLLFRQLSEAALLDDKNGCAGGGGVTKEGNLVEAFCQGIEEQL